MPSESGRKKFCHDSALHSRDVYLCVRSNGGKLSMEFQKLNQLRRLLGTLGHIGNEPDARIFKYIFICNIYNISFLILFIIPKFKQLFNTESAL